MTEQQWQVLPPEEPPRGGAGIPLGNNARLALAFAIAVASDVASMWLVFIPPVQWGLDVATALILFLLLGRQWLLLPALIAEAIPGLAVLPAWILVVGSIAAFGIVNPLGGRRA